MPVYFPMHAKRLFLKTLLWYICLLSQRGVSRDSKLIKTQKHIADKRHLGNWFRAALQCAKTHPLSSHFVLFFYHSDLTVQKRKVGEKAEGKTKREREEAFRLRRGEIRSTEGLFLGCLGFIWLRAVGSCHIISL